MLEIVKLKNPFDRTRRETERVNFIPGQVLTDYITDNEVEFVLNGNFVEYPNLTFPCDGDQVIVMPHVGGGGFKSILGTIASMFLMTYVGGILNPQTGWFLNAGKATLATYLAAGAVMYVGGRIINSVFPTQQQGALSSQQSSQTYGWDTPQPITGEGGVIGITYGECIPAPQVLERHVETINGKQYLNLLLCGGMGPVDIISDIKIGSTPIGNFRDVTIETRLGTNDQEPISFFTDTPLDQAVGLELTESSIVQTSDSKKAASLEVTVEFPGGLYHVNDDGGFGKTTVVIRLEYRKYGNTDWTLWQDWSISAAQNTAVRQSLRLSNLTPDQYQVRATITSRNTSSRYCTTCSWSVLTAYNPGKYARPNKVLVGLRILATNQLSGSIPNVTWRQIRNTVHVWNPENGKYETRSARNPIWVAYDIYHQCRYLKNINTGEMEYVVFGVDHKRLDPHWDEWSSEAAAYSDEQVAGLDGTMENRFEFDAFYDTEKTRYDAAQLAANVGHAVIMPRGNNIGIKCDKPGQMVQIFGEGRTTMSSLNGTFSATKDRALAVEVVYSETGNDFKNTPFLVRSPKWNTSTNVQDNPAQLQLFGVKRRSQAYREGVYTLANNELITQFIDIGTDIDALVCQYGDLVGVNHSVPQIGIASGRIVSATQNTVQMDKTVTLQAGLTYQIYIQLSTDELVTKNIVAVSQDTDTDMLTVTEPFSVIPEQFDNYVFGETDKAVKPFRLVGVEKDGDLKCKLSLAEYVEGVYSGDLNYPIIDYTPPGTGTVEVTGLNTAVEIKQLPSGDSVLLLHASWNLERGIEAQQFAVYYSTDNGETWTFWEKTENMQTSITGVQALMTYVVKVCTYNGLVQSSGVTSELTIEVAGDPPDNLDYFAVSYLNGKFVFNWKPANNALGYEIRKNDWNGGQFMMRVPGHDSDYATFNAFVGTSKFVICPYNNSGYASEPMGDSITVDSIPNQQVIATISAKSGTITGNGSIVNDTILQYSDVTYADIKSLPYSTLKSMNILGKALGQVVILSPVIDVGTLAQVVISIDEQWLIYPDKTDNYEISTSVDGVNFSDFKLLTAGSLAAKSLQLRITLNGSNRPGALQQLNISIMAQMQTLNFPNLTIPVGGVTLEFKPPFLNAPSVIVSPNGNTALTVQKSNVTNQGGTVQLLSGSNDVGGAADIVVTGI